MVEMWEGAISICRVLLVEKCHVGITLMLIKENFQWWAGGCFDHVSVKREWQPGGNVS